MGDRVKEFVKSFAPPSTKMMDRRFERLLEENRILTARVEELSRQVGVLCGQLSSAQTSLDSIRSSLYMEAIEESAREPLEGTPDLVVSIASYGPRIANIAPMLQSVGRQSLKPSRAFLWVPSADFQKGIEDIPASTICALHDSGVELRWVEDNLGPHNKYFWAMKAFPDSVVITLDDDIYYPPDLLGKLVAAHGRWEDAIVGTRVRRIGLSAQGIAPYSQWRIIDEDGLDVPKLANFVTGVGGALYPPHSFCTHLFDIEAIKETCLYADDLWLKVMSALAGTKVVCPSGCPFELRYVSGTQDVALFKENQMHGRNDLYLQSILAYIDSIESVEELLVSIRSEDA